MKVNFNSETTFRLSDEEKYADWVARIIASESRVTGQIAYIFCEDSYLLKLNEKFLNHDTLTDIITFDYCEGDVVSGDIFISIERVEENAKELKINFREELHRVMSHGVLHLIGYSDKVVEESRRMRLKENEKMELFHVEQ